LFNLDDAVSGYGGGKAQLPTVIPPRSESDLDG
jgi:hypothetical protein